MVTSHSSLARDLLDARLSATPATRPSARGIELTVDQAYRIQFHQQATLEASGQKVVALKLGLTDQAQRERAGWMAPSFGFLTDSMLLGPGQPLVLSEGIHPRVEPEWVAVIAQTISQPISHRRELLEALEGIHVGIEVVDPRYQDSAFVLTDAIADNASAFRGVIGLDSLAATAVDWAAEELVLTVNGVEHARGIGSNLMGDPLLNVEQAINERLRLGQIVPAGLAIFCGNIAGNAVEVSPGDTVSVISRVLGHLNLSVV